MANSENHNRLAENKVLILYTLNKINTLISNVTNLKDMRYYLHIIHNH